MLHRHAKTLFTFSVHPHVTRTLFALFTVCAANAGEPVGYYAGLDRTSPQNLKASLHELIDDHTRVRYTSGRVDTWDVIRRADADPATPGNVITLYRNASYPAASKGNPKYNREHSWPKSYGFPKNGTTNYPYTDLHHLFAADSSYNSSRGNVPYGYCSSACTERQSRQKDPNIEVVNEYPGRSNWRSGSGAEGTWEVWIGRQGDVARAMFYMAIRYEGGIHSESGAAEPDLELTDDIELIASSNTGFNESTAYMGRLSDLLKWHHKDPVDHYEQHRNDVVFAAQGNRNPFVDRPELVCEIFHVGICAAEKE